MICHILGATRGWRRPFPVRWGRRRSSVTAGRPSAVPNPPSRCLAHPRDAWPTRQLVSPARRPLPADAPADPPRPTNSEAARESPDQPGRNRAAFLPGWSGTALAFRVGRGIVFAGCSSSGCPGNPYPPPTERAKWPIDALSQGEQLTILHTMRERRAAAASPSGLPRRPGGPPLQLGGQATYRGGEVGRVTPSRRLLVPGAAPAAAVAQAAGNGVHVEGHQRRDNDNVLDCHTRHLRGFAVPEGRAPMPSLPRFSV